ncbi:protein phosphatase 2C domain-containing protein [Geobacter sp. FeAm09]|uniref:protein phosphatase 2C domain-containing protein n=1 Tax=Geobacter sp. FeAm09 TaxID=2597769 RepID=UPI00143CFEAE|nr:protein phosphatase 2C domain-containing protein [Geobacter sp. FeAm09]
MYSAPNLHTPIHRPYDDYADRPAEMLLQKGSGTVNEDVLLRDGNLFGVFDGATSLANDNLPPGTTGGLLAARIAAHAFRTGGSDLYRSADLANRQINVATRELGITDNERHLLWSTSAAVVRIEENHADYCQIGDSLILLVMDNGRYRLLTHETDHDLETLMLWKNLPCSSGLGIGTELAEQIKKVRLQMNRSYGTLNGEAVALDFLNCGRVALDGVAAILLFTDGLFLPKENPEDASDWSRFVACYQQGGLQEICDHVRALQQDDPFCRVYPRFKLHDDIAAIAINLHD